ncbi:hypothetical protein [Legionella pneumophila]|uniref:hypothetical protein n=1 Tax=Legionella pneumophila TaxID=446 RepID=UPI0001527883|nr:hypothetical protein [Legionella pneumophila]ABQ54571.1 hypothetical protein LPC_0588 [Legionella pneumophila str. Corby]ADG24504.1 hypothetical protein lpa_01754 [Legionella pneumophila 2300/99 Alcoy]MCZ4680545.1 hypothetical protein [Legionella pneumophila]CZH76691.1 Uncharacterised protein [Legionella pneumophila]CZI31333.1 Uncharacterised protein [Legionella pneumophila]
MNENDTENKYVFIATFFQATDGIHSIRYGINKNGELFSINTNGNKVTPIDILPQGVMAALAQYITQNKELIKNRSIKKELKCPSVQDYNIDLNVKKQFVLNRFI